MDDDGWEKRMAARSLSATVLAQELARAETELDEALARLSTLRAHGKGPIGEPGCCHEWRWVPDMLSPHWYWGTRRTCSADCTHPHHEHEEILAIG